MQRIFLLAIALSIFLLTAACEKYDKRNGVVFTLYTNAASDQYFRTSIATFDLYDDNNDAFNEVNAALNQKRCNDAAIMFQEKWVKDTKYIASDPGVALVRHWCEKGRFKK